MGIFRISYCTSLVGRFYIGVSGGIDYTGAKYKSSGMGKYLTDIHNGTADNPGGKIGELTQKLYDTLTGIQWGKLPDTKGWTVPVDAQ